MIEKKELPILPLKDPDVVVFPGYYCEIDVGRPFSVDAIAAARSGDNHIIIAIQKSKDIDMPSAKDFFVVCTEAEIKSIVSEEDNKLRIIVQGTRRGNLKTVGAPPANGPSHYYGEIEFIPEQDIELTDALMEVLLRLRELVAENLQSITIEEGMPENAGEVSLYIDNIAAQLPITGRSRLKLLRLRDITKRLEAVMQIVTRLTKHEGISMTSEPPPVEEEGSEEGNVALSELQRLRKMIEDAKMEGEALSVAKREFRRLQMIPANSAEFQVAFNYVETIASLPWTKSTEDKVNIDDARKSLDNDHFGLEKVKERILEFLAVRKLAPDKKGSILCFAGPPGVGKTSLGKSIAEAMGRNFIRMSLGGVNDEAEIRGHRRTYVGALPGKIIQMIRKVASNNPVFMLDEVDKLCRNMRGDPAASLLEVLDPEQNHSFMDNYLGLAFDLSKVMFIATVNDIGMVPHALRDRMEIIEISGYSTFDKVRIAQRHLIDKKKEDNGLKNHNITISPAAISRIIEEYTNEAGVRSLERYCGTLMRKMAVVVASDGEPPAIIKVDTIPKLLGPPKVFAEKAADQPEIGLSAGLAWSTSGGSLLFVESCLTPGKGDIELTGNLGEVIKESAKAAHTWIKTHAAELGIDVEDMAKKNVHIHFPSGAVPKDGPSAGIAVAASILSVFLNKPVHNKIAMTGEISLRGRIMPIGGLREKVLAAHRAGIEQVLYPAQNEHDLEDIPEEVKNTIELIPVSDLSDALSILIVDGPGGNCTSDLPCNGKGPLINKGAVGATSRNSEVFHFGASAALKGRRRNNVS